MFHVTQRNSVWLLGPPANSMLVRFSTMSCFSRHTRVPGLLTQCFLFFANPTHRSPNTFCEIFVQEAMLHLFSRWPWPFWQFSWDPLFLCLDLLAHSWSVFDGVFHVHLIPRPFHTGILSFFVPHSSSPTIQKGSCPTHNPGCQSNLCFQLIWL